MTKDEWDQEKPTIDNTLLTSGPEEDTTVSKTDEHGDANNSGQAQFIELTEALASVEEKAGKGNSFGLLVVTVFLFFSAGILTANFNHILILIGVLFFHELGHLVTMKLLRYRDVKMFFIPFLGAAVSGRSDSDSALKSALVSLMGPLPGIALGSILFPLYLLTDNPLVLKTAQVMLLLNAFNLFPIMPLDGGRTVDVLFVNHRRIRLIFALLGAAAFIVLALLEQSVLLAIMAFVGLQQAFQHHKVNAIAATVRPESWQSHSIPELLETPGEIASALLHLQEQFPKLFSPQLQAVPIHGHLRHLVETLRFKPAGMMATFGISLSYGVLLLMTLGLALGFGAMQPEKRLREEGVGDEKRVIAERYLWQHKVHEIPLDADGLYHGIGTGFSFSGGEEERTFEYHHGLRHGTWKDCDEEGNPEVIRRYEGGTLVEVRRRDGSEWNTQSLADLPLHQRLMEELRRRSQPITGPQS